MPPWQLIPLRRPSGGCDPMIGGWLLQKGAGPFRPFDHSKWYGEEATLEVGQGQSVVLHIL